MCRSRRFAGDGAKIDRAEKLHQTNLRNVVDIVFPERLDVSLIAPVVDGGFSVAGNFGNRLGGQHIGIAEKQLGIMQPQMLQHDFGNLFLHLDSIITLVPACRGGVAFGEHLAVFQIGNDIRLFDFVAARFPTRFLPVYSQGIFPLWSRYKAVDLLIWQMRYS